MTRKTRRSKAKKDGPESESQSPKSSSAESQDQASAQSETPRPEKKISLPAFGFAEDLLAKKPQAEAQAAEPETAAAAEPETAAAAEPNIDETDPRRIFAFADSLGGGSDDSETAAAPVKLQTWVAFSLAGEVFALPVEPVHEVVRVASITRVPHAPKPIRGVTNMRGRVIPVIDLRLRIELPEADLGRSSRVVVVSSRGRLLGLLVDAVHQVIHIDLNRVQPPPDDVMTVQSDYISGVYHLEDQLILLLDIHRVLIINEAQPGEAAGGAGHESTASEATSENVSTGPS